MNIPNSQSGFAVWNIRAKRKKRANYKERKEYESEERWRTPNEKQEKMNLGVDL